MDTNPMQSRTPLKIFQNKWDIKGLNEIYIKDESFNPFGTAKDRRNEGILTEALRLQVDKLALITSGNNGVSLAKLAGKNTVKVVSIISKDLPESTKKMLKDCCYQVIETNLNHKILRPEEVISFAREQEEEVIWDVTNGYESYYSPILKEILYEVQPNYIVVPVGSGGLFVAMAEGVSNWSPKTKVIGIGVKNNYSSFADKLHTPWTPYTKTMEFYCSHGHTIYRLDEQKIRDTFQKFKNKIDCEPSSAVVYAAADLHPFKPTDVVVFINTGKIKVGK